MGQVSYKVHVLALHVAPVLFAIIPHLFIVDRIRRNVNTCKVIKVGNLHEWASSAFRVVTVSSVVTDVEFVILKVGVIIGMIRRLVPIIDILDY